jgi:transcriptional regulator with XRE-family HTH domain
MNNKGISRKFEKQLMILSNYLKELRFNDNSTQVEVAEESGLHRNTISNIETSKNFTVLTMLQLCDFYQIPASELLSIIDEDFV